MANRLSSGLPKNNSVMGNNYLNSTMGRCPHRKALLLLWQRGFKVLPSQRKRPLLSLNMGLISFKEILGLQDMFHAAARQGLTGCSGKEWKKI